MKQKLQYCPPQNGYEEWNNNPAVFTIGRMDPHVDVVPFDNLEMALSGRKQDMSRYLCLNGTWKFSLVDKPADRNRDFISCDFDVSHWHDIMVPGHWQLQGFDYPQYTNIVYPWSIDDPIAPPFAPENYNPVGSYVRFFTVPERWAGDPVILSFQGVESAFYVWINGDMVGYNEGSFTPAEFDITPYLVPGENRLALEVFRWCDGSWLEDQDFFRLSGIFRDVYLYSVPAQHIMDFTVVTELDSALHDAFLNVKVRLEDYWECGRPVSVEATLFDAEQALVKSERLTLASGATDAGMMLYIEAPKKWNAEEPYLYTLVLTLRTQNGDVLERLRSRVGFRKFEIIGNRMYINGRQIKILGMNRHEWDCKKGRTLGYEEMLTDVKLLKQYNINAVRTSHYPDAQEWYDLCDEYGIYLMDECNLETHGTWRVGQLAEEWDNMPGSKPWWTEAVLDRAATMLHRDKNHPSVIIWSLGNESFGGENFVKMHDYLRAQDPTRPVHYEGVYHFRPSNAASDMESQMYTSPEGLYEFAQAHQDKPIILCEYSHGTGNSVGNMKKYCDLFDQNSHIQGGYLWDWKDKSLLWQTPDGTPFFAYGGDFGDRPNDGMASCNGMFLADGTPKPQLYEVKRCYQPVRVYAVDIDKGLFEVENRFLFLSLRGQYTIHWRVEKNGAAEQSGVFSPSADAGDTESFFIPLTLPMVAAPGDEYWIHFSAVLSQDTLWAPAGYEVAFDQFRLPVKKLVKQQHKETGTLRVEENKICLQVYTPAFEAVFNKDTGNLDAYRIGGQNYLASPPEPYFWRAPVFNDIRTEYEKRCGGWRNAGQNRKLTGFFSESTVQAVRVEAHFQLPTKPFSACTVQYDVTPDGAVRITMQLSPGCGLPEIPAVGMMMTLDRAFAHMTYFGLGPYDTYWDRQEAGKLGVYETAVSDNFVDFPIPQECGNRTGVRWASFAGDGMTLTVRGEPTVELSALPWTPEQVAGVEHSFQLPQSNGTVLRINEKQTGVGGDISWGTRAVAHPEFVAFANRDYTYSFTIFGKLEGEI